MAKYSRLERGLWVAKYSTVTGEGAMAWLSSTATGEGAMAWLSTVL